MSSSPSNNKKRPRPISPSENEKQYEQQTNQLRKLSRQTYLERREAQQLQKLQEEIQDEKSLFANEQLTEKERQDLALKENIYRLAVERSNVAKDAFRDTYHVPGADGVNNDDDIDTNNEHDNILSRYSSASSSTKQKPQTDGAQWELDQIKKGSNQIFSSDLKQLQTKSSTTSTTALNTFSSVMSNNELDFQLLHSLPAIANNDKNKLNLIRNKVISDSTNSNSNNEKVKLKTPREIENEKREKIQSDRKSLPMYVHREELMKAIKENQILIVQSETGSGKTTQIPQYIIEEGMGPIVCTQPRRVAAMSVASRVAYEMGVKLGGRVGYTIRFEDCSSEETEIKFVTDGMLLREFLIRPDLKKYKVIMIDEAHERSLNTDILMGLIKDIAKYRGNDIRIIISSATINTKKFSKYFNNAPIYTIPGKRFHIDIYYTKKPQSDYIQSCCKTILQIHISQTKGDILVFLTGQDEIESTNELLVEYTNGLGNKINELIIAPIYSTLPSDQQAKIFQTTPPNARKVVLATNIAETSITIPGIVYVIDTGFSKQKNYNAKTGVESLLVLPVSKAGAKQRTGRAGRLQPGKCFRLYTKWSYDNEMDEEQQPELLRSNINQTVLLLLSLGINNLMEFDFLDHPSSQSLLRSLEHLYALGAINDKGELTKTGRYMIELPLDPMLSKCLIASEQFKCTEEVIIISSMLSINNIIFYKPKGNKKILAESKKKSFQIAGGGDHMSLLRCYVHWRNSGYSSQWCFENFIEAKSMKRARDIYNQLDNLLDRIGIQKHSIGIHSKIPILKSFTSGFFYNACRLQRNGHYKTMKNSHTVYIHPSSCLAKSEIRPRWLVFHELVFTSKEYMRQVFDIEGKWLHEVAPHFYKEQDVIDTSGNKMPKVIGKAGSKMR